MCSDIKPVLEKEGALDDFYFLQVKEKYNRLCCYHNGAPREVEDIISKYEMMASYICTWCGKPATYETRDYIESFCEACYNKLKRHRKAEKIEFRPEYKVTRFQNGVDTEMTISFEDEWSRYLKENGYERYFISRQEN